MKLSPEMKLDNKYVLIELVGRGSTAEVWSASLPSQESDSNSRNIVALKIFSHLKSLKAFANDLFKEEFKKASMLNHPNILKAQNFIVINETPILQFELCDSCLEKELLNKKLDSIEGRQPFNHYTEMELMEILFQVSSALDYLHKHKIIHNDIKPANIVYKRKESNNRQYFLTDLGISIKLKRVIKKHSQINIAGAKTVLYAAPEKLKGNNEEYKSDIFSLGIVLYELAGGENLTMSPGAIITNGGKIQIQSDLYSQNFKRLFEFCIRKDPKSRPSAAQIAVWCEIYLKTGVWPSFSHFSIYKLKFTNFIKNISILSNYKYTLPQLRKTK